MSDRKIILKSLIFVASLFLFSTQCVFAQPCEYSSDCDDGISCTLDTCDPINGCQFTPNDPDCPDDGLYCNGTAFCDPGDDCQPGISPNCDDGIYCTDDICDEVFDTCLSLPNDTNCPDDGLYCNGPEFCDPAIGCFSNGNPCFPLACDEFSETCIGGDNDNDEDGIPDDEDLCPTEDATGLDADLNGCIDNIANLPEVIECLNLHHGIENSLLKKIEHSQRSLDKGNLRTATNQLKAFTNLVEAQYGKKLSEKDSNMLIGYADNIVEANFGHYYQVFGHIGHMQTIELTTKSNWPIVSDNMDGFWVDAPTFRGLPLEDRQAIVSNSNTRRAVVVMPLRQARGNQSNLVAALEAGMRVHTLMIYKEPEPPATNSLLSQSEMEEMYEKFGSAYILLFSMRKFEEEHKLLLKDVDGFNFEIQVRTDPGALNNLASAIIWGLDHGKTVYLLTPPNHAGNCENPARPCIPHNEDKNFLHDYQRMKSMLEDRIGWQRLYNPRLRFVPANYAYWYTFVKVAPEHEITDAGVFNANTQTGAARWLILTNDVCLSVPCLK